MSAACSVTVLRSRARLLAKVVRPSHTTASDRAKNFDYESAPVACLDDLAALLGRLLRQPQAGIVRGALINSSRTREQRRLANPHRDGSPATLREEPRRWVVLDMEGIPRPPGIAAADLAGCGSVARALLPPEFQNAACVVTASASHGLKADLRLHLGFWLDRATSSDELHRWLAGTQGLDLGAINTASLTYTAAPVFADGAVDPLPARLARLEGASTVAVPSPERLAPPPPPPAPPRPVRPPASDREAQWLERQVEKRITNALNKLGNAGKGSVHAALRTYAVTMGGLQYLAGFSDAEAVAWGLHEINAPGSRGKDADTIKSGLHHGRARPFRIDIPDRLRRDPPPARPAPGVLGPFPDHRKPDPAPDFTPCDPPFALPDASATDLHQQVLHAISGGFFAQRRSDPPPRVLVPGPTGSGKTEKVARLLPHIIAADKAERALQPEVDLPWRCIVMVPAHRLGRQIRRRYERFGLSVATIEGRGDPWKPNPARPSLCQNPEPVGMALSARQDVRSAVCGSHSGMDRCAFFETCGYLRQFDAAAEADVVIVTHNFLFERLPAQVLHHVAYVVIEEDFAAMADAISELPLDALRPAALARWPVLDRAGDDDADATAEASATAARLAAMFDALADGTVPADAPAAHGLMPKECTRLRRLHDKRHRDPAMTPGMSLVRRKEALKAAEVNAQLPRIASALTMLANGETDRLRLCTSADARGNARRSIIVHGQRKLADWIKHKPVLLLDASANIEDVRRFFPDATQQAMPRPRLRAQRVHQVAGSFGKRAMTPAKLAELEAEARAVVDSGRTVLVVCHQQDAARFRSITDRVIHHGDSPGDDDHGGVDVIMQIGGPFAPPAQIAELATARYGQAVPVAGPVRVTCAALMEDGSGRAFSRYAYADPLAQRVHQGIYDQAFVQGGLGRGRGLNRSAATPLEIRIFGNVDLPVPLASLSTWVGWRERRLVAEHGMHSNAADLFAFSGAFSSHWNAAGQLRRHPFDEARLRDMLASESRAFVLIQWQPCGSGHKRRRSVVAAADAAALREAAERRLGPLKFWEVAPFTEGRVEVEGSPSPPCRSGVDEESEVRNRDSSFKNLRLLPPAPRPDWPTSGPDWPVGAPPPPDRPLHLPDG